MKQNKRVMKLELREHKNGRAELEVEVSVEEMDAYQERATEQARKELEIEGFRKGKAPVSIVADKVGERAIVETAAQLAVSDAFRQAISEHELKPVSDPEVAITKLAPGNPMEFKLIISVMPEIVLPDYEALAGAFERAPVEVTDEEVESALSWLAKSRSAEGKEPPALTDEFARSIGAFENLEALKASIKEGLESEKGSRETDRFRQEILEKVAESSRLEVSPQLVASEQRSMVANLKEGVKSALHISFEDYLRKIGKTEEELASSFEEEARKRVRNYFVLRAIAEKENIQPSSEEIETETVRALKQYQNPEEAEREIDPTRLREYTELVVRNEKTLAYLESLTKK